MKRFWSIIGLVVLVTQSIGYGCTLSDGISTSLPSGSSQPFAIHFAPNSSLLVTSNTGSDDVSTFAVVGSALFTGQAYGLAGGAGPFSATFSPD